MRTQGRQLWRLTFLEILTIVVVLVVMVAVAIPLWRSWELRARRDAVIAALLQVQAAQDRHFASQARYADDTLAHVDPPVGLGLQRHSNAGHYTIHIQRSADLLGYVVTARALTGIDEVGDTRCAEFRLDEYGRRSAVDAKGQDSTADCWNRL
jgi:type IV pilus assembly protein PilE